LCLDGVSARFAYGHPILAPHFVALIDGQVINGAIIFAETGK